MNNLVETFCDVDDFCKVLIPQWENTLIECGSIKRRSEKRMSLCEIMTILISFHQSYISLSSYLTVRLSESTGIAFIDSTKILLMSAIAEERGQKSGGNCSNNLDRIVVKVSLR